MKKLKWDSEKERDGLKRTIEELQKEIKHLKEVEELYMKRQGTQQNRIDEIQTIAQIENGNLWSDISKSIKEGVKSKFIEDLSHFSMSEWLGKQNPV